MSTVPKKKKKTGAQKAAAAKKQTPFSRNTEADKRRKSIRDVKTGDEKPKRSSKANGNMDKKDPNRGQRPGGPGAKKTKKTAAKNPAAKKTGQAGKLYKYETSGGRKAVAKKAVKKTASAESLARVDAAFQKSIALAAAKKKERLANKNK